MSSLIPAIGTKGIYELKAPYMTQPNELYKCVAVRSFIDIENFGVDVFDQYYSPFGIDRSVYTTDRSNGVAIVALQSEKYPPVYVPSSFILSFPDLSSKPYHHVVVSASLGALPDTLDLTFLTQQVAKVISDVIGVEPSINLGLAPMTGVVSAEQHEILTAARQAKIANRTTDYARLLEANNRISQLEQRNRTLEKIVIDKGLLK